MKYFHGIQNAGLRQFCWVTSETIKPLSVMSYCYDKTLMPLDLTCHDMFKKKFFLMNHFSRNNDNDGFYSSIYQTDCSGNVISALRPPHLHNSAGVKIAVPSLNVYIKTTNSLSTTAKKHVLVGTSIQ